MRKRNNGRHSPTKYVTDQSVVAISRYDFKSILTALMTITGVFIVLTLLRQRLSLQHSFTVNPAQQSNFPINQLTLAEIDSFRKNDFHEGRVGIEPVFKSYVQQLPDAKLILSTLTQFSKISLEPVAKNVIVTRTQRAALLHSDLKFFVTNQRTVNNGIAGFDGARNQIYVGYESHLQKKDLIRPLRNELHHAQIHHRNQQMGCNPRNFRLLTEPFCGADGQIDTQQADLLVRAVENGHSDVKRFYEDMKKTLGGKTLSESENSWFEQGLAILKAHEPSEAVIVLPPNEYKKKVKPFLRKTDASDLAYRMPRKFRNVPFDTPSDTYYSYIKQEDRMYIARYRYAKTLADPVERVNAFITEWMLTHYVYKHNTRNAAEHAAEMSSSIEEFDSEIKSFFFPEVCSFFSNFHQVQNYCQHLAAPGL